MTNARRLNQTLGRGEAECIALAKSQHWIVLTDDRDARRTAREAGLIISGTLGALMNLVRGSALSLAKADEFLATMKRRGYRCPVNSLSELDTNSSLLLSGIEIDAFTLPQPIQECLELGRWRLD